MQRRNFLATIPILGWFVAQPVIALTPTDASVPLPYNGEGDAESVEGVVYWLDAKGKLQSDRMSQICVNDFARVVARKHPDCTIMSLRFCEWGTQVAEWRKEDGVWYNYVRGNRHCQSTFMEKSQYGVAKQ